MSNAAHVTLGAIPYWAAWSEGQVVFSHVDGVYGHGSRIVVRKSDPTGLLYVNVDDNLHDGFVPASHIARAVELAETVLGPNHFPSLDAERDYRKRLPLFKVTHFGPWRGWKSGLVQIRGKAVFAWGAFRRTRPTTLIDLAKGCAT